LLCTLKFSKDLKGFGEGFVSYALGASSTASGMASGCAALNAGRSTRFASTLRIVGKADMSTWNLKKKERERERERERNEKE